MRSFIRQKPAPGTARQNQAEKEAKRILVKTSGNPHDTWTDVFAASIATSLVGQAYADTSLIAAPAAEGSPSDTVGPASLALTYARLSGGAQRS